ncbi:MAG TPA: HD domain-containing phosphohydrolase [Tepidisphaeraceae bacterium]|jgi:HD-GYP domain-containing protein (c-di-GMP phosphodiesterase class II)
MASHATNPTLCANAAPPASPGLAHAALDNLAARLRPSGLFLVLLRADGSVGWHDGAAPAFHLKFVLPQIQNPDLGDPCSLRDKVRLTTAASGVCPWCVIPGVEIVAFPHVEKRHLAGIVLLAARSDQFSLGEDVLRACSRLGLDAAWLGTQADQVAPADTHSLQGEARLLQAMVRDQLRLAGLEQELDSLSGQLANSYEELSLIYQISSGMKVNRRAHDFFKQTCLDVMEVLGVRGMGVALCGDKAGVIEPSLYGQLALTHQRLRQLSGELIRVLRDRKSPLLVNDVARDRNFRALADDARQLIAVPLQRQDEVLGCLFGIDKHAGEFDSVDAKLLNSIANESAIYLENAKLFEDVHGLMMGLLHALTSAVDAKDAYTCGHSERVALLSRRLAREARLPDNQVDRIYMAGLLHDVGKIGVPEAVLQKTGRLTPEEFEQMKKHPGIGARILADIKQVEDIIPGVLHHHERFDGKGYPAGLSGHNIPLMGRIICLADCFDAMTSNRTYRRALPLEVALSEIRRCSGTQFDPALAEAFLRIGVEQFRELLADHQSQARRRLDLQESLRAAS